MNVKSMVAVGFLGMVAVIGAANVSSSFAAEMGVERHEVGGAIYSSSQTMNN